MERCDWWIVNVPKVWYSVLRNDADGHGYIRAVGGSSSGITRMPLFDAIESDVTAFFVSQGTVFDTLVKSFMDRVALVESSVAMLRTDVSNNFNLVHQRIDASNVAAAEVSAATAAAAAAAAASAALASLPNRSHRTSIAPRTRRRQR